MLLACLADAVGLPPPTVDEPAAPVRWSVVEEKARAHGVLLYLTAAPAEVRIPHGLLMRAQQERLHATQRNLFLAAELVRLTAAFGAAAVDARAFKGPVAGVRLYGDLSRRPSGDLDLMVPEHQWMHAAEVLAAAGYESGSIHPNSLQGSFWHPAKHLPVDLHWGLPPKRFGFDTRALFAGQETVSLLGQAIPTFTQSDTLLIAAINAIKVVHDVSLRGLLDVAACLGRLQAPDWRAARRRARQLGCERFLLVAAHACWKLFGDRFDTRILRDCRSHRAISRAGDEVVWQIVDRCNPAPQMYVLASERSYHRSLSSRRVQGARLLRRAVVPTESDTSCLRLPRSLEFLYLVLRPVRLSLKYGTRALRRSNGPRRDKSQAGDWPTGQG